MLQDWLAGKDQVGLMIQNTAAFIQTVITIWKLKPVLFDLLTEDDCQMKMMY